MKCFEFFQANRKNCNNEQCRYWIDSCDHQMCSLIAAKNNEIMTLEQIGNIFNVTRMRVCQIEKKAIEKIKTLFR